MTEQARVPAPNYTQIPNVLFDLIADKDAGMTEAELRVLLAIARKTFGWHKRRDKISLTQLEKLTAMSRPSVVSGIEAAERRGIIRRTPDRDDKRGGFFYEMVVDDATADDQTSKEFELVQKINQSNGLTRTSKEFELDLVKKVNTQKKEKEKKERACESPARTPAVALYFETFGDQTLKADQVQAINSTVTNLDRWRTVLTDWSLNGWNPKSIGKLLDRYSSGTTIADERPAGNRANGKSDPHSRPPLPVAKPEHPPDARPAHETAARMLELLQKQRNEKPGHDTP